jgi:hypothetical protein
LCLLFIVASRLAKENEKWKSILSVVLKQAASIGATSGKNDKRNVRSTVVSDGSLLDVSGDSLNHSNTSAAHAGISINSAHPQQPQQQELLNQVNEWQHTVSGLQRDRQALNEQVLNCLSVLHLVLIFPLFETRLCILSECFTCFDFILTLVSCCVVFAI